MLLGTWGPTKLKMGTDTNTDQIKPWWEWDCLQVEREVIKSRQVATRFLLP